MSVWPKIEELLGIRKILCKKKLLNLENRNNTEKSLDLSNLVIV